MLEVYYGSLGLHTLGEVSFSQQQQYDPPESPQRVNVTLRVRLEYFAESFKDNYGLMLKLRDALRTQHGVLRIVDGDSQQVWVNQTVELASHDLPEDPNAWGTYNQRSDLVFTYVDVSLVTNAQGATFTAGGKVVDLGRVTKYTEAYQAKRFSDYRDQRERVTGTVTLSGYLLVSTEDSLAGRRAALLARRAECKSVLVTDAFGLLAYADFSKNVRVESPSFEIDQSVNGIAWSFSANYTQFPDEATYATAELDCDEAEDVENGELKLNFSGRIQAADKTTALAKLAAIRAAMLTLYGYTSGQRIAQSVRDKWVSANSDDATANVALLFTNTAKSWIELTFQETYRRRRADILSWTLRVASRDDTRTGLILTTYSGTVTCSGAVLASITLSENKARELVKTAAQAPPGEGKAFLLSQQFTYELRQLNQTVAPGPPPSVTAGTGSPVEFLKLDFQFEYQSKLEDGRIYLELTEETSTELLGGDTWNISGFVVALNRATADAAYVRLVQNGSFYTGRLVRNERKVESKQTYQALGSVTPTGSGPSSIPSSANYLIGLHLAGDPARVGFQFIKLDFSFQAFKPKTAGIYAVHYSVDIARNFKTFEKTVTVQGSVYGEQSDITKMQHAGSALSAEPALLNFLDQFLLVTLGLSKPVESRRAVDHEFKAHTSALVPVLDAEAVFKLDFTEVYDMVLTPDNTIIECSVTEEVTYSSPRFVVRNLPGPCGHDVLAPPETVQAYSAAALRQAVAIVQETGLEPGRRTVRGSVTAAVLSTAETWARNKRMLMTGSYALNTDGTVGARRCYYCAPPRFETEFVWKARTDAPGGVVGKVRFGQTAASVERADADTANVRMYKVNFSYEEILPYYPMA